MNSEGSDMLIEVLRTLVRVDRLARSVTNAAALMERTCVEIHSGLSCSGVWALLTGSEAGELLGASDCWHSVGTSGYASFSSGIAPPCAGADVDAGSAGVFLPECVREAMMGAGTVVSRDPSRDCAGCPQPRPAPGTHMLVIPIRSESVTFGALAIGGPPPTLPPADLAEFGETVGAALARTLQADRAEKSRLARQMAAEKLIESEERYAALVQSIGGFSWEINTQCLYTYVSPAVFSLLGRTPAELIDRVSCFEIMPEDQRAAIEGPAREAMSRGETITRLENTILRADGTPVVVSTTGFPIRDGSGAIVGYRGIDLDVTRWKALEADREAGSERARKQRAALSALLARTATPAPGMIHSLQYVAQLLTQTLGVHRTSIWEMNDGGNQLQCIVCYDHATGTHHADRSVQVAEFAKYFDAIRASGVLAVSDALHDQRTARILRRKNLPEGPIALLDAGIFLDGQLVGLVCAEMSGDTREWQTDEESFAATMATFVGKHLAEIKSSKTEERLRLALSSANQGIYDANLHTGEVVVSPEYAIILGHDPATFRESVQDWVQRLHPMDRAVASLRFEEYMAGRSPEYRQQFRLRTANGDWKWILSLGRIVERDDAGKPLRMAGTHTDISRLKELEFNLREREKESRCLFEVARALRVGKADDPLPLEECAASIVRGMLHPARTRAMIHWGNEVAIVGCEEASTLLASVPILGVSAERGQIAVHGLDSPELAEPIAALDEEVTMLEEIARLIESEARARSAQRDLIEKQTILTQAETIANLGSWVFETETASLSWSEQVYAIFGIPPDHSGPANAAFEDAVHPDDRDLVRKAYEASLVEGAPAYDIRHRIIRRDTGEVRHVHERCVHTWRNGRVIRSTGTVQDVTEQAQSTERLVREAALRSVLQQVATQLAGAPQDDSDKAVDSCLASLGQFVKADRSYVLRMDWTTETTDNTHEWCAPGTAPMIDQLRHVPISEARELIDAMAGGKPVWLPDVSALPEGPSRRLLEFQSIQSLLLMPMMREGRCVGAVGFDWVHQARPLIDPEVEILRVFSSLILTHFDRVAARRSLEDSLRRHRLLFESMTQGVVVHDATGALVDCNPAAERILSLTREQICERRAGDTQWGAIHEDGTPFPGPEHPAIVSLRTGEAVLGVVMGLTSPERVHWVRITSTAASLSGNDRIAFSIFDDVTAERETQKAIKLLASQVEQAPFGIIRTGTDRLIAWVNDAFTRLTGYAPHEAIGKSPGRLLQGPDTNQEVMSRVREHLNAVQPVSVEVLNYTKAGTPYWVELTIAPLFGPNGGHTGFVGFARDISERVRAQKSLRDATHRLSLLNDELENRVEKRTEEVRRQAAALENSIEGVAMYRHGECIYRNAAHQRLFGPAGSGCGWRQYISPISENGSEILGNPGESRLLEARATDADGRIVELDVDVIQLQDDVEVLVTRDVTERNRAARELAEAKRFLETVMDSFPIAVFWKDRESRYLGCNSQFAERAGIPPSKIIGRTDDDLPWLAEQTSRFKSDDQTVIQSGKPILGRLEQLNDAAGNRFWLDTNKVPLRDSSGAVIGVVGSFQDVSARIEAQLALEEREARYHALMENAGDAILTARSDGRLIEANQRAESFLGYTRQQLETMHFRNLHRIEDLPYAAAHFKAILQNESAVARDVPVLRADGTVVYVDITGSLVRIGDDVLVQGIFHDATERRETEIRLRDLSEQLSLSLASGRIGCWSYDVPNGRLTWDQHMFDLYGKSPHTFTGMYEEWSNSLAPEDRERAETELRDAVADGAEFDSRFAIITPHGDRRTIQARSIFLRDGAGIVNRVIGINYDITDMIEREQALEKLNASLAEATRQKDEFLANMSHELRTPLNAILGMSEALAMGIYGDLTTRQLESLKRVEDSGRHLLSLINDVLDLAKIEAGRIVLEPEVVGVRDLVTSMARLLEQNAKARGINLSVSIDPDASEVLADPRRLRQILLNLLSNALKFTDKGGKVQLRTQLDPENNRLAFEVSDTGEGIAPEKLDQLFRPFTQLESTLTKRHAGTGLGLSIVKRLAEMHGGSVAVTSKPGEGSTFTVSLPWIAPQPSSPMIPVGIADQPASDATGRRLPVDNPVLLVEDNDSNTAIVRDFLISAGYHVETAANGAEAVQKAANHQYAIILMDVQMPEMDGLEATRRIRKIPGREKTPIIALTSFAMPGDRERCLSAGMTDYMSKPVSLRALMMTIKNHLRIQKG